MDSAAPTVASDAATSEDSLAGTPAAVDGFLRFVEQRSTADSAAPTRDVTVEGLRLLASALASMPGRDSSGAAGPSGRLDALRARTDSMQAALHPVAQARIGSEAFVLASELLQGIQDPHQPALTDRGAEVRAAAAAVRPDVPLVEQQDAVARFFRRAAAALRGAVGAPTL